MTKWFDRLGTAFDRLSPREQGMVLFLVIAVFSMLLGFGGYTVKKGLQRREAQISARMEKLERVGALQNDYRRRLSEQEKLAEAVKKNNGLQLLSYLEDIGKKADVPLQNIRERAGLPTGSDQVREVAAEVMIKDVSIDRLNAFLERIEKGNPLVKVRKLKVKTRFDNPKKLDASITVGTYKTAKSS